MSAAAYIDKIRSHRIAAAVVALCYASASKAGTNGPSNQTCTPSSTTRMLPIRLLMIMSYACTIVRLSDPTQLPECAQASAHSQRGGDARGVCVFAGALIVRANTKQNIHNSACDQFYSHREPLPPLKTSPFTIAILRCNHKSHLYMLLKDACARLIKDTNNDIHI